MISECRFRFVHCGKSFNSPAIYKYDLAKRIAVSGSVFQASSHSQNASTDAVHLPRLPSWVHWYRCCILSRAKPQFRQSLVVTCPCRCRIFMVGKVLLMHFVMKFAM